MIKKSFKTLFYLIATFLFLIQSSYALNLVELSPGYYPNSSRGRPLATADIYVGKPDLDPEIVVNQKQLSVQQEDGTIVAVTQPIHTSAGGVPQYAGSPVVLLVEGDYSLKVLDSSGVQIYYVPSTAYEQYLIAGNYYYPDYAEADQGVVGGGETVTDILAEVGAVTEATMYFSHNSGATTTTYTFTTNTTITDNFNVIIERGVVFVGTLVIEDPGPPSPHRSRFRWKDADEIYIGAGSYDHVGSTRQTVYWNSEITFHLESTGSNALSDDYGADGWHYIYLDDSAIITQASALLDADCFLNETTAPTYSATKHGWYNGNDRCISAVYETGDAIYEFYHDGGDSMSYVNQIQEYALAPDTTFTDVDMATSVPGFSTKVLVRVTVDAETAVTVAVYYRPNGATGATGQVLAGLEHIGTDQAVFVGSQIVFTDSSQIIEIKTVDATSHIDIFTMGWYFPVGM